jgi:predicted Zn-ribbon and HTH transcriptional regulator
MASCTCGFNQQVRVGGTRASFQTHSYFPYLCEKCGVVDVNVAAPNLVCPKCKSDQIDQYGQGKVSDPSLNKSNPYPRLQDFDRKALQDGHKCPKCGTFNLSFSAARMHYD